MTGKENIEEERWDLRGGANVIVITLSVQETMVRERPLQHHKELRAHELS